MIQKARLPARSDHVSRRGGGEMMVTQEIDVFAARCEARALLWATWQIDLHTAVDVLQDSAEHTGLVGSIGQDHVQAIMSDAFSGWRIA